LNKFCRNCEHRNIPSSIKQIFNKHGGRIFVDECPILDDPHVVGCTTKLLEIEWITFLIDINKKGLLSKEELEEIAKHFNARSGDSQGISSIS
jgi:hypothetical protein